MTIDIKTAHVEPLRTTFDHIEARLGPGKSPTRYQEGVFDLQMTQNFHYRPTWQPEFELFDRRRTAIVLDDFDALLDPRQYYYAPYTIQRARQQETQDANFNLVEKRRLCAQLSPAWQAILRRCVVPLRHFEWGANTNNTYISAYGYGAPITSAAVMQAMDRLGNAQFLTRLALSLSGHDPAILDEGKHAWLEDPCWQPLRRVVEDSMVTKDWFELHVVQNLLLDAAFHPFAFEHFDAAIGADGGIAYGLMTEFQREWFGESKRWTDATIKIAAGASAENRARIDAWIAQWRPRVFDALTPVVDAALGNTGCIGAIAAELDARLRKIGLAA